MGVLGVFDVVLGYLWFVLGFLVFEVGGKPVMKFVC